LSLHSVIGSHMHASPVGFWHPVRLLVILLAGWLLSACGTTSPQPLLPAAPDGPSSPSTSLEQDLVVRSPGLVLRMTPTLSVNPDLATPIPWSEALRKLSAALLHDLNQSRPMDGLRESSVSAQWLVEPFRNGNTGEFSAATREMTASLIKAWQTRGLSVAKAPQWPHAIGEQRWLLLGGLTPLQDVQAPPAKQRPIRLCAAVADLRTGQVVARATVVAEGTGLDTEPSAFFRAAPLVAHDVARPPLDRECRQLHPGSWLPVGYRVRMVASPFVHGGIAAYESGAFLEAVRHFESALELPAGHQMRSHTGLYLSQMGLGLSRRALPAFENLVDLGLDQGDFQLKVLYRSSAVDLEAHVGAVLQDEDRIDAIARRLVRRLMCMEIAVSSPPSSAPDEDFRLGKARAQSALQRLAAAHPVLLRRLRIAGSPDLPRPKHAAFVAPPTGGLEPALVWFRTISCY